MHFVPVGGRAGGVGGDGEFGGAEAVGGVGAVCHDAEGEGGAEGDQVAGFGGGEVRGVGGDGEVWGGVFAGGHFFGGGGGWMGVGDWMEVVLEGGQWDDVGIFIFVTCMLLGFICIGLRGP